MKLKWFFVLILALCVIFAYLFLLAFGFGWTKTNGSIGPFTVGQSRIEIANAAVANDFQYIDFVGCKRDTAPGTIEGLVDLLDSGATSSMLAPCSEKWIISFAAKSWMPGAGIESEVYHIHFGRDGASEISFWHFFSAL